jgi:hypothetical protein
VRRAGDDGVPTAISLPDSTAGVAFHAVASRVAEAVDGRR